MAPAPESPWLRRAAMALALVVALFAGWYAGHDQPPARDKPSSQRNGKREDGIGVARGPARSEQHLRLAQCEILLSDFADACLSPPAGGRAIDVPACGNQIDELRERAESAVAIEFLSAAKNAFEAGAFRATERVEVTTAAARIGSETSREPSTSTRAAPPRDYAETLRAEFEGED